MPNECLSVHSARCGGRFLSVSYPKLSVVSISVPALLHSQQQSLQAARSFWGPQYFQRSEGFKHSCPIALRVHDHRPNSQKLSSAADSLQEQACQRHPTSAVKCVLHSVTQTGAAPCPPAPHLSLTCQNSTATLSTCLFHTRQSRTGAPGWGPNIGSFPDPVKITEMPVSSVAEWLLWDSR